MDVNFSLDLSDRMSKIDLSGIRKVFDLASKLENPINLSIGQPDFDVPDFMKAAAFKAMDEGENRYTPTQGIEPLRREIAHHLENRGIHADSDEILVTSGVSGALTLIFLSLLNPGDEVILPDPYFVSYLHLCHLVGAKPVFLETGDTDFLPEPRRLEALINSKTKLFVLSSPSNPTGAVLDKNTLNSLVQILSRHKIPMISDEIYTRYIWDGESCSAGSIYPGTITVDGWSKSAGATGWRIGFLHAPVSLVQAAATLQQYTYVCAPAPFQRAALKFLQKGQNFFHPPERYRANRDRFLRELGELYSVSGGKGAFYLFPKVPSGETANQFCMRAIKDEQLLVIPGSVFSKHDTHFRLCYAVTEEVMERGIQALKRLASLK